MPYNSNAELPKAVKNNLPPAAQTIWRKAWNSAYQQYGSEERAAKVAWAAVKRKYKKQGDRWVPKEQDMDKQPDEAKWSRAKINDLPDAAFAYIEPGGKKDETGKTTPRDLRHFPHHTSAVKKGTENNTVDKPHLRNALSRIGQGAKFGDKAKPHLVAHAKALDIGDYEALLSEGEGELLTETLFTPLELTEQDEKGYYHAKLLCTRGDYVNGNGRVYPMSIWEREVPRAKDLITQGRFIGLADHPSFSFFGGGGASMLNTVIKFDDLRIEGREVWGDVTIIPTSKGKDVIEIAKAGVQIGASTRGRGRTKVSDEYSDPDGVIHKDVFVVTSDYKLDAIDLVLNPSMADAGMYHFEHLSEEDMEHLQEMVFSEVEQRVKEQVEEPLLAKIKAFQELTDSQEEHVEVLEALKQDLEADNEKLKEQNAGLASQLEETGAELEDSKNLLAERNEAIAKARDQSRARTYIREAVQGSPYAWIVQGLLWDAASIDEAKERMGEAIQEAEDLLTGAPTPTGRAIITPAATDQMHEELTESPQETDANAPDPETKKEFKRQAGLLG